MLTKEQIVERVNYLGSSDAAAILGFSRWKTPLQVWGEKVGAIEPEDISDKLYVKLGNKLEQTVAELFMEETGKKVQRVNETIVHQKYPFLRANLDRRVIGERSFVEAKTCSIRKAKEWEGEEFPVEYIFQVNHQLAVTGMERAYLAVLIGNEEFKIKTFERDEKIIDEIVRREVAFWNNFVIPKIMPASVTRNDADTLFKLFPEAHVGEVVALDDKANALVEGLEGFYADLANLEGMIEQQKNELKVLLKDAEIGETDKYRITWKNQKQNRIDTERLKTERPDLYLDFLKACPSRVLRYKKKEA